MARKEKNPLLPGARRRGRRASGRKARRKRRSGGMCGDAAARCNMASKAGATIYIAWVYRTCTPACYLAEADLCHLEDTTSPPTSSTDYKKQRRRNRNEGRKRRRDSACACHSRSSWQPSSPSTLPPHGGTGLVSAAPCPHCPTHLWRHGGEMG